MYFRNPGSVGDNTLPGLKPWRFQNMPKYAVVVRTEVAQTEEQLISMLAGTFGKGFVVDVENVETDLAKISDFVEGDEE